MTVFMKNSFAVSAAALGIGAFACCGANAQEAGSEERLSSPFSFELNAGAEYDSNVSVNELDANTGADDVAAVIDADIEFETALGKDTEFNAGYSFSQSLYSEFTDFNLQSHFGTVDLSHDFGVFDLGAAYRLIYTRLGGDGFLLLQQASPYVSRFFGKKLFVRADYTFTDTDFEGRVDRDAEGHAGGADFYYFANGVRTYFVVGYKYEDEDAVDPQFDFHANNFKARFAQRIPLGARDMKFKLGWRYEQRDHTSVTPSIGVERDDDRHRFEAELEVPVTDRVFLLFDYEYGDFSSNLPSADYTQHVASARAGLSF